MSVQRWSPWRDIVALQEAMNEAVGEPFRRRVLADDGGMEIDLRETDDSYVVKADVPGFSPDEIDVSLHQNMLRISASRKSEEERTEGRWLIRERRTGRMERSISLPETVHADQAEADFSDGVLTISIPKREDAKPRSIQVRSGG